MGLGKLTSTPKISFKPALIWAYYEQIWGLRLRTYAAEGSYVRTDDSALRERNYGTYYVRMDKLVCRAEEGRR